MPDESGSISFSDDLHVYDLTDFLVVLGSR